MDNCRARGRKRLTSNKPLDPTYGTGNVYAAACGSRPSFGGCIEPFMKKGALSLAEILMNALEGRLARLLTEAT